MLRLKRSVAVSRFPVWGEDAHLPKSASMSATSTHDYRMTVTVHSCVTDDFPGTSRAGFRPPRTSSSTWVQSSGGSLGRAPARSPLKALEKSGFARPERLRMTHRAQRRG